jgi:hypothetical protein
MVTIQEGQGEYQEGTHLTVMKTVFIAFAMKRIVDGIWCVVFKSLAA